MNAPMSAPCPFCTIADADVLLANEHAVAFYDAFPISLGHSLVIPKLHVGSIFELPVEVQAAMWSLVSEVRLLLVEAHRPTSFNMGVNDGPVAGQTVPHAHVHLIPRYEGDVADPRGGIRWIIPAKADYWSRGEA